MSQSKPPQGIAPDLKSAATALASTTQIAMASLYSLHTALINAQGSDVPELRELFVRIRTHLMQEWRIIVAFLQKCVAFGGDVTTLNNSLATESPEDCVDFLMDMASTSTALLRESEVITQDHGEATKVFARQVPQFTRFLQKSSAYQTHAGNIPSDSTFGYPTGAGMATQSEFVETNIAAMYPNGLVSLVETETALAEINSTLVTICQFWQSTSDACNRFLSQSSSSRGPNITLREANHFAEVWKDHMEGLKYAINSIAKSCDAILVEAVGAPPSLHTPPSSPSSWPRDDHRHYTDPRCSQDDVMKVVVLAGVVTLLGVLCVNRLVL